ncbi:class I SAM-dependent rRNA methyltransferase [Halobacillus sp. A5]|uniref:class I SAM-dependent rRNA methyltransferase n=1 Tax=Halobacillus sp. A5 TaxID=2880263 RepID=UPI0020A65C10|nr:class I SAM-dependent rRNA methyltransferase [Halobacillus sp. A5]MCP3027283.1 class I SAM-dependent rRNA methyltransferase [Halobacillus sp. A5]
MKTIKIKNKEAVKFKKGYPLLQKSSIKDFDSGLKEGDLLHIIDENHTFIGKGYYGLQNKGIGWIITSNSDLTIDQKFFSNLLSNALGLRKSLFQDTDTNTFRVFNGEGDGFGGLTIDKFADYYLLNWYSEGAYQFRNYVLEAIKQLFRYDGVYEKKRFGRQGQYIEDEEFVMGERGSFPIIVKENGIQFAIYLNEGAMVGLFLDQREVRQAIRNSYSSGKRVLNTFSYTGAFSVFSVLGGASHTTSVDLANRSYAKTIENFSLNGVDYEAHDIIVEDVFNYFKYANRKKRLYDLVVLDPPSFARSKKNTFRAEKDYPALLQEAISITEREGVIIASTNCAKFNMKKFKSFVETAFNQSPRSYKIVEEYSLPNDFKTISAFKEGNYLKVLFLKLDS